MARWYATKNAIIAYIRADADPRPLVQICKYMLQMHRCTPHTTRTALWRLCKAGVVVRDAPGWYRMAG